MTINVNNNTNQSLIDGQKLNQQQQTNQQQSANNAAAQAKQAPMARQDSVSLTQSAQQLNQLQKKASDGNTVNQEKVDKLKKAIINGEYRINPERMAQKIATLESELFGIKK